MDVCYIDYHPFLFLLVDTFLGSGSQVVPAILEDAQSVTQFIRVRSLYSLLSNHLIHFTKTPQHYVPMTMGNYRLGNSFRKIVSRFPIVLLLLRWLTFWILDSTLLQFYNNPAGQQKRKIRTEMSQRYIMKNAPGSSHYDLCVVWVLIGFSEQYWPLLIPESDLGCKVR